MRLFSLFPTTFTSLLVLIAIGDFANAAHRSTNSILLKNIQTLTLKKDAKTSHRRVSAIPQVGHPFPQHPSLGKIELLGYVNFDDYFDEFGLHMLTQIGSSNVSAEMRKAFTKLT